MIEVQVSRVFPRKRAGRPPERKGETAEGMDTRPGVCFWDAA